MEFSDPLLFFFKGHSFSPKSFSKKKNIVFARKFPISSFAISKENFYLFFLQKFKFEEEEEEEEEEEVISIKMKEIFFSLLQKILFF